MEFIKDFDKKYNKLESLEWKINTAYSKSRNVDCFFETKTGSQYVQRWKKLMTELRGWDEYRYDDNGNDLTTSQWKKLCEVKGLNPAYTIWDVCA